jgi:flagellum-specific peptidoglycan hydrolase FlgJ
MKTILIFLLLALKISTATAQPPDFSKFKECEFLNLSHEYAVILHYRYDIPPEITMAVSILESAYGRSYAARVRCNHFGIAKGKRVYKSVYGGFIAFGQLLKYKKRYKRLFELDGTNYKAWAIGLRECGYNNGEGYPDKLIKIILQYRLNEL